MNRLCWIRASSDADWRLPSGLKFAISIAYICNGDTLMSVAQQEKRTFSLLSMPKIHSCVLDPSIKDKTVRDLVTPVHVTIAAGALVSVAEILMQQYKIRAPVVADCRQESVRKVGGLLEIFADRLSEYRN